MTADRGKPRVLVFNQYYWPGVEATAQLLAQLCEALATDFEITIVTGRLRDSAESVERLEHNGVEIVRVASTMFDRRRLLLRALNYVTFLLAALTTGLRAQRPDVVVCMTDPPLIGNVALQVARRFRAPLVVITQDVFPEIALELGRLENPAVIEVLRRMISYYLRRADRIVAIGETMQARLEAKGASPDRIRVIPNWVDTSAVVPFPRDNEWAASHNLLDRFVVMHSGNVGHSQNLGALVNAGTFLRDLDRLAIVIIGTGARRGDLVAQAMRVDADVVRFYPYQPREIISKSLSSADVHYVGLAPGLAGYVVPSRIYGILAAGRPLIVSADSDSETTRLVSEVGCGVVVPPNRPDLVGRAIRSAYEGELDLAEMGRRGREYVIEQADRSIAVGSYRSLLAELTTRPA